LDYSARDEARVLRGSSSGVAAGTPGGAPPAYLREVWRGRHWRLFEVRDASPLVSAPALVTQLDSGSFSVRAPAAGAYTVRVHFTPYWALAGGHGCVSRAPGDWTTVQPRGAGTVRVVINFSLGRVFSHGPR